MFNILHTDKTTQARIGELHTAHGVAETPFFMPVATKAAVKHICVQDLQSMKAKIIISNAFILFLRPGHKAIEKLGGIHKFMNWDGISFTDSGGFQMYKDTFLDKTTKDGVQFKSPFDGQKYFVTPELDMEIQMSIGSDVHMCLDRMPLIENTRAQIEKATTLTAMWALRCKVHHDRLNKSLPKNKHRLLFGITQGGIHADLREKSCKELAEIGFDGYSVGGLALGEDSKDMIEMVKIQKKIMPKNKPIYLMGLGSPVDLIDSIALGVDIFDSIFPTQSARRGTLYTSQGRIRIKTTQYQFDETAPDPECNCFVCKNYTKAYVHYQLKQKEPVGYRLASYHNLYYLQKLMRDAKKEIKKGTFKDFQKKIQKLYSK